MVVPHDGNGKFMIIGEAPGKEEEKAGKPFVGKSGKLLFKTLSQFGIQREDCWVTNVIKIRPENNRTPTTEEVAAAVSSLYDEVVECDPKVILAVGGVAASAIFLKDDLKISEVRGVALEIGIRRKYYTVLSCYHPSYIFRKTTMLPVFKKDIEEAVKLYGVT